MTTLHIAADFFFDRWDDPARRQLWLSLQPYYDLSQGGVDGLRKWIAQPEGTRVELIHLAAGLDPRQLVPVPLPPIHASLTAALHESDEVDRDPPLHSVRLDRSNQYRVTDSLRLFALNHRADGTQTAKIDDIGRDVYQVLFWTQLQDAAARDALGGDELCDWLRHTFEVGQRVYFDDRCMVAVDPLFDASLPFDERFDQAPGELLSASNRHCLLGLMLPLGNAIEMLSRVHAVTVAIGGAGRLELTGAFSGGRLPKMFATIPDLSTQVPTAQDWDRRIEKRVHAIPIAETYAPHRISVDGSWLWRQHRGRDNAEAMPTTRWEAFERLVIRYGLKGEENAIPAEVAAIERFSVRPEVSLDVQLEIYRRFPLRIPGEPGENAADGSASGLAKRVIVAVRPASHEMARFRALMAHDAHRMLFRHVGGEQAPDDTELFLYRDAFAAPDEGGKPLGRRLSPAWVAPFAFPWLADGQHELLACFDVEQDADYPDEDALRRVLVGPGLLRLRLPTLLSLEQRGFEAGRPGQIARGDPFGPRWDYWHIDDPQRAQHRSLPDFDALSFEDLPAAAVERIAQLIVSGVESDRRAFEWSQSARRIEGVFRLESDVIDVDDTSPVDAFTATQAYSEDRLNFNTINVVESRSGRWASQPEVTRFLNHSSELPSIHWSEQDLVATDPTEPNKRVTYVFQLSFTDRTSVPLRSAGAHVWQQVRWQIGADPGTGPVDTRSFYSAVYGFAGEQRDLALHLQHTYGSCIALAPIRNVPDLLDEPIAIGADVSYRPPGDRQPPRKLWRIELGRSAAPSATTATLVLDHELLATAWVDAAVGAERDARNNAHNAAWQSVAEMAHGGDDHGRSLRLVAELFRFDVYEAMQQARPSIAGGLIARVEDCGEAATARIVEAMKQWLERGQGETRFPFDLPSSWLHDFHAIRFRFEQRRAAGMAPTPFADAHSCPYTLHQRPQRLQAGQDPAQLFGADGLDMLDVGDEVLKAQLKRWVDSLNHAGGYISPTVQEGDVARYTHLRQTLGTINERVGGVLRLPAAIQEADDAWIAPAETVDEGGDLSLSYCPIGFEPLAWDPFLREQTSPMIRRYFSGLQTVVELRAHAFAGMSSQKLLQLLESWGDVRRNCAFAAAYAHLARTAAEKLHAIPDPDAAELHPLLRDVAARINQRHTGLGHRLHEWFQQSFRLAPGGFDELKGFGLLELGGERFARPLRADFHALTLHKRVRASEAAPETSVHGLASPGFAERDIRRLAFVDPLPDTTYDNAFKIDAVRAESVERVLEQHQPDADGKLPGRIVIDLHADEVYVPEQEPVTLKDGAVVCLASRRPVSAPSLGFIAAEALPVESDRAYALAEFLKGRLQPVVADEPAVVRIDLAHVGISAPQRLDETIVAGLFAIFGDEETAEPGVEAFANDLFHVQQAADVADGAAHKAADDAPEPVVVAAFEALAAQRQPEQIAAVDALLSTETLRYVGSAVGRERTFVPAPGPHDSAVSFRLVMVDERPRVQLQHVAKGVRGRVSLFLQHGDENDDRSLARPRYFVLIELVASIWNRQTLSLVQTRNQPSPASQNQRHFFAPRFTTVSDRIGDTIARRPVLRSFATETRYRPIDSAKKSAYDFCAQLLKGEMLIDQHFGGRHHRLMVTIKEDSSVRLPAADGNDRWVSNGTFAVRMIEIVPMTETWQAPIAWFPDALALRYRVDFEWRDVTNNDSLLRIEDVPVERLN